MESRQSDEFIVFHVFLIVVVVPRVEFSSFKQGKGVTYPCLFMYSALLFMCNFAMGDIRDSGRGNLFLLFLCSVYLFWQFLLFSSLYLRQGRRQALETALLFPDGREDYCVILRFLKKLFFMFSLSGSVYLVLCIA